MISSFKEILITIVLIITTIIVIVASPQTCNMVNEMSQFSLTTHYIIIIVIILILIIMGNKFLLYFFEERPFMGDSATILLFCNICLPEASILGILLSLRLLIIWFSSLHSTNEGFSLSECPYYLLGLT